MVNVNVNLEEVCNGVVNSITNETMISYKKVINCPALRTIWIKAIGKELGRIAPG